MSGDAGIRVYVERLDRGYARALQEGFEHVGLEALVKAGDTVFLKPNLTYPVYREGVMTRPECVEALIVALRDRGLRVIVGESDGGGYNRFSMDEVFAETGLARMAERYGVRLVNLSRERSREIRFTHAGRDLVVPLPALLLEDVDLFITVPVPKVHMNTGVSMSIKNQWGCIQQPSLRLKLHPFFTRVIHEINRALRVRLSVIDGKFGLDRNGPMRGDPVKLDWLLVANDIGAADTVCCSLMGIDPAGIEHLRFHARSTGLPPSTEFALNRDPAPLVGHRFRLQREVLDYPGYLAFRSSVLAYVAYHSPLAGALHKALYMFREKFYDHP